MNKVLYITTVSRTINAFLIPHIETLLENGYEVDCACSIDKPVDNKLLLKGVQVYEVPFSRNPLGIGNIKAFIKLIKLQKKNSYDIFHVHTPVASIYGRLLKLIFPKTKTIYTAHGYHFFKGGSLIGWIIYYPIEKIMSKLTDVTININKEDYEITKTKLKPRRCYLVNGVGLSLDNYKELQLLKVWEKKMELSLKVDDFIVLMIAEINKNKNHIQLIKAMELLKDKYLNIKAICVGDGENLDELKSEVKHRHLEDNIMFLGFRKDINELINIANIGILLSYREGLPRNIMEFMACGKKIIGTDIRGCRDIICTESVGSLVKVNDYVATAQQIEKYYLEFNKDFIVSDEIKKYDVKTINNQLINIYKEMQGGVVSGEKVPSYFTYE